MLFEEMRQVVAEVLTLSPARLTPDVSLTRDLGVDSLDILRLVHALELKYQIEIDTDQLDLLDNLGFAVRYVESLLAARS